MNEEWEIRKVKLGRGVLQYTAFADDDSTPACLAWVILIPASGRRMIGYIDYAWTAPFFRRKGALGAVIDRIFRDCDTIMTGDDSTPHGKAWMKKRGWKHHHATGSFYASAKSK